MDTDSTSFDHTVDVLVVGSGAGAMTAALRAHDQGATDASDREDRSLWRLIRDVVLSPVDPQQPPDGGRGCAGHPGGSLELSAGHHRRGTAGGSISEDRLRAFLEKGPEALEYLAEKTHAEFVSLPEYSDYYPRVAGSKPGGRSVEPEHFDARQLGDDFLNMRDQNPQMQVMGRLGMTAVEARMTMTGQPGGMMLFAKLCLKYIFDLRWRFRSPRDRNPSGWQCADRHASPLADGSGHPALARHAPARELIVEDGRVTGVVAREGTAREIRIGATRGVILGAGGFEGNQAMREKYLPNPTRKEWSCGNPAQHRRHHRDGHEDRRGNRSHGRRLVGADHRRPGRGPGALPRDREVAAPQHPREQGSASRFTNEAAPYIDIVNAMYEKDSPGDRPACRPISSSTPPIARTTCAVRCFKAPRSPTGWCGSSSSRATSSGRIPSRSSPAQLGVDADGLEGRQRGEEQRVRSAPARTPSSSAARRSTIATTAMPTSSRTRASARSTPPPSTRSRRIPGELGTKGGLAVDARARVRDRVEGEVIPGLYAIGNCSPHP